MRMTGCCGEAGNDELALRAGHWGRLRRDMGNGGRRQDRRFPGAAGDQDALRLFRGYVFRNIGRYRKITVEENGRPGELYYHCAYAFNAALVLGLAALAIRLFSR